MSAESAISIVRAHLSPGPDTGLWKSRFRSTASTRRVLEMSMAKTVTKKKIWRKKSVRRPMTASRQKS